MSIEQTDQILNPPLRRPLFRLCWNYKPSYTPFLSLCHYLSHFLDPVATRQDNTPFHVAYEYCEYIGPTYRSKIIRNDATGVVRAY